MNRKNCLGFGFFLHIFIRTPSPTKTRPGRARGCPLVPKQFSTFPTLRALASVSGKYGNGILHLTTRQDIQVHGVSMKDAPNLVDELFRVGLVCRGGGGNTVRNVTADPCAGIDKQEPFDVTPYAIAVTEYLLEDRSSFNLPRKFKLAFSASSKDRARTVVADLGFVPVIREEERGFTVYAGGGMGANSRPSVKIMDFLPSQNLCHMAETVKRVFDSHGDRSNRHRARLRFVLERMGQEKFKALVLEAYEKVCQEEIKPVAPREKNIFNLRGKPLETLPANAYPQEVPGLYMLQLFPGL
ncbi:MAG: nitrite/sulfite reductase, partial [bacterium]|nr:nitrite/sulfite reductase [bacterium]